jgi:hypothetical protein
MKLSPFIVEPEAVWIDEVATVVTTKLNEMFLNENIRNIQIVNSIPAMGDFLILIRYQRRVKDENIKETV